MKYLIKAIIFFLTIQYIQSQNISEFDTKNYPFKIYTLGDKPNWTDLDIFQNTITRSEFESLLRNVYITNFSKNQKNNKILSDDSSFDALNSDNLKFNTLFKISDDEVDILASTFDNKYYKLQFKKTISNTNHSSFKKSRYWRSHYEIKLKNHNLPLDGIKIAIDPGHIGGDFAKMEERYFDKTNTKIDNHSPVMEGEMTLIVAKKIKTILEKQGAIVSLLRSSNQPLTKKRPNDFLTLAKSILTKRTGSKPNSKKIKKYSELLFYRVSEIRSRAKYLNTVIKPDLVLCIHFNAEAWGDPKKVIFSPNNHLHFLLNGCYSLGEVSYDDQRFEMISKLLQRTYYYELSMINEIVKNFNKYTDLPPYVYKKNNARSVGKDKFIWARNLLANRLYNCPVIYCEPYVMNNKQVYNRIQAGDYEGIKNIDGYHEPKPSIFNEYAKSISNGIIDYYTKLKELE